MADMNFNFDLSGFNKGIDEIQKRIQQLGAALKVATDPKSVKSLTAAIQEASNELDSLKSNLSSLGSSLSSTLPSIGNAIASSMNLATTSMDAMVTSSAQLVAQLQAAQGMATKPFVQQTINQQTQQKQGPAGGAMFGAGGDVNVTNRTNQSLQDLNNTIKQNSQSVKNLNLDWANLVQGLQDGSVTLSYSYQNVGNAYSDLAKKLDSLRILALNTAAAMENMSDKESQSYKDLTTQLKNLNSEISKYSAQKHNIEVSMGGSKKSRFTNELFSVQQILREMPAFTYSVQTGFLALSNNIPILIDDFKRMRDTVVDTNGKTLGWKTTLLEMGKQMISFTGIATIVTSILTIFGPKLWDLITGTKELTEAQKELNKELKANSDAYNENIGAMDRHLAVLNNSLTTDEQKIVALRQLEELTGRDLVKSYNSMTESIKAANDAGQTYLSTMKQQIELDRNMTKVKFATNKVLDAEAVIRGVQKKNMWVYENYYEQLMTYDNKQLEGIIRNQAAFKSENTKMYGYLAEAVLQYKKYSGSLDALGANYSKNISQRAGDVNKQIANTMKAGELKLQEDLAELAKKGTLTDDKVSAMTIAQKKQTILDIRKLNKDATKKDNMFIFQEEEKLWLEIDGLQRKATKKANKDKDDTVRTFVEKEVNIEKQLIEDRRNLEKLRLEIIKDSYDKQALIIEEKYDEMAEKARQRNEDELKTLKDNFENRIEFQRQEADIREKASKMSKKQADAYVKREMDSLKELKDLKWRFMLEGRMQSNENDRYLYSQIVRSNEIMGQTIKRQQENLYKELTDMARGYALARFNEDRAFTRRTVLENVITNEETLKIQLQQYKNFLDKIEKFNEERAFKFEKSPIKINLAVGKNKFEDFFLKDIPKYQDEIQTLLNNDPSSERIGVLQNAISKLKGEIVDFNDIFNDSLNGYEKLKQMRDSDIKDIQDSTDAEDEKAKSIDLVNSRYETMITYLDRYRTIMADIKANPKQLFTQEDVQSINDMQDKIVLLTNQAAKIRQERDLLPLDAADPESPEGKAQGKAFKDKENEAKLLDQQIAEFQKKLEEFKKQAADTKIYKVAFEKLITEMNESPEFKDGFKLKVVPQIDTKNVFDTKAKYDGKGEDISKLLSESTFDLKEGDFTKANEKLRKAFGLVASMKEKLSDSEKTELNAAFKTQFEEGSKILDEQLDKQKGKMVAKTVRKGNLTEVPKEFSRREMWAQNKLNLDLEGAELEHQRKILELKKTTIGVTEKELEEFHKKEMEFIQKRKTFIATNIKEIANAIGSVFQSTFDQISTFANNSMQLQNETMALMQAQSDNLVASYDNQINKLKEIMDTQIMSAEERINAEQRVLDLERLKAQEEKNQKIRALELQKKQIEVNKKLALAQAAISGGIALANVVAIATEGAVGTGPAAPFVFAAELAAGIGAVGSAIFSAKQAIESADIQTATIDEQIAGIEASYQAGLSKGAGVTSASTSGQGPSAPLTTFNKDLVNQGQSNSNYNVNDTLKGYKIYVTQADIQNANNQVTKITKKVTFG